MLIEEIPYQDPALLYESLRGGEYSFFLDSGMDPQRLGRYSILGYDPFLVVKVKGREGWLLKGNGWRRVAGDPLALLKDLLKDCRLPVERRLPITGGFFGYFAYDLGRQMERLPDLTQDDLSIPDFYLGGYDALIVADQLERRLYLVSTGLPEQEESRKVRAGERLRQLKDLVRRSSALRLLPEPKGPYGDESLIRAHFTRESYHRAIQRVKDYIAAGDIFQANFTQRFSIPLLVDPWLLYRRLRRINPAPFAAYLNYPELTVASASPERFLKVADRIIETRPIKGTRPRGRDPEADARLSDELLHSAKDRAELTMIIDLERNDLGRVCDFGSVHVPELITLERYATVFHLVSTVRGVLRQDKDLVDLLKAAFPGGSITGAPKIRAMEIIEELEPVKRGIYTGSIGYLGFDGRADLNIVIRTFIIKNGRAYLQVGGGIVADSDPDGEYLETIDKARALFQALGCREEAVLACQRG